VWLLPRACVVRTPGTPHDIRMLARVRFADLDGAVSARIGGTQSATRGVPIAAARCRGPVCRNSARAPRNSAIQFAEAAVMDNGAAHRLREQRLPPNRLSRSGITIVRRPKDSRSLLHKAPKRSGGQHLERQPRQG